MKDPMWHWLDEFPGQIEQAWQLAANWDLSELREAENVAFLGIGGSAIGADLICGLYQNKFCRPVAVIRGEDPPAFLTAHSLVVAISYSGDTQETLTALARALDRGARAVCISSGGGLLKLAVEKRLPFLRLPAGMPPRAALGYASLPLVAILEKAGALSGGALDEAEVRETVQLLQTLRSEWSDPAGPGVGVARRILRRLPMIMAAKRLIPAARRFQTQLAENAKALSVVFEIPEALHNLIETLDSSYLDTFRPIGIYLEDADADAGTRRQMQKLRESFQTAGVEGLPLLTQGRGPLARLFGLVHKCDWISYHLAILKGVDPVAIPMITKMKQSLTGN
ncbi:MAG TPA: SIS domain-containing protein [bacterium]|jgi:glucose/mannose-6-phosphate isomerase